MKINGDKITRSVVPEITYCKNSLDNAKRTIYEMEIPYEFTYRSTILNYRATIEEINRQVDSGIRIITDRINRLQRIENDSIQKSVNKVRTPSTSNLGRKRLEQLYKENINNEFKYGADTVDKALKITKLAEEAGIELTEEDESWIKTALSLNKYTNKELIALIEIRDKYEANGMSFDEFIKSYYQEYLQGTISEEETIDYILDEFMQNKLNEDLNEIVTEFIDEATINELHKIVDNKMNESIWDIDGIMKEYAPYLDEMEKKELEGMLKRGEISVQELLYSIYVKKEGKLDLTVLELIYANREVYDITVPDEYANTGNYLADLTNTGIALGAALSRFLEGFQELAIIMGEGQRYKQNDWESYAIDILGGHEEADKRRKEALEDINKMTNDLTKNFTERWKEAFYNTEFGKWADENAHDAFKSEGRCNKNC